MIAHAKLPPAADPRRPMPEHAGARIDVIEAALRVLGDEDRRLGRMGLEGARARCSEARRYWGFVAAMVQLADAAPAVNVPWKGGL